MPAARSDGPCFYVESRWRLKAISWRVLETLATSSPGISRGLIEPCAMSVAYCAASDYNAENENDKVDFVTLLKLTVASAIKMLLAVAGFALVASMPALAEKPLKDCGFIRGVAYDLGLMLKQYCLLY